MTTPLTAKRKREAIQRAKDRVKACDHAHDIAWQMAWEHPFNQTYQRRADAALADLEAARDKLARITKEYGES